MPWWNKKCDDAINNAKSAYRKYKNDITLANYLNYKRLTAIKKAVLKRERKESWVKLCESFNRNTPVNFIWKNFKKFKNSTPTFNSPNSNSWIEHYMDDIAPPTAEINSTSLFNSHLDDNNPANQYLPVVFV